jgi:hypothetical protein
MEHSPALHCQLCAVDALLIRQLRERFVRSPALLFQLVIAAPEITAFFLGLVQLAAASHPVPNLRYRVCLRACDIQVDQVQEIHFGIPAAAQAVFQLLRVSDLRINLPRRRVYPQ